MSDSDDKKDSAAGAKGSSASKPAKRTRKRQASHPPTIDVKAVHLKSDTEDEPDIENAEIKNAGDENNTNPKSVPATDNSGRFGYRALIVSSGIGAAASIVLFAGVFGVDFFTGGKKDLEEKLTTLSGEIKTLRASAGNSKDTLANDKAIKALKQQMHGLLNRPEDARFNQFGGRIKSLEILAAKPKTPPIEVAELKDLSRRLETLSAKTDDAKSLAEKAMSQAISLEKAVQTAGETFKGSAEGTQGSLGTQNLRLAGFEAQIKRLSENLDILQNKASASTASPEFKKIINNLQKNADSLKARIQVLDDLMTQVNTAVASSDAATLKIDQRLARLEQEDKSDDTGRLAALSFAIEGLVRKIEIGDTFSRELVIVTAALPNHKQLKKLSKQAQEGVKAVAQLQRDFLPVLKKILAADNTPPATGVMGKLVGTAKSLIRIRRIGDIEGDSQEAVIARLETGVKAGNLTAALVEAKKLRPVSAKIAAGWMQSVEERLTTIELIKNIRNDVISSLGPTNAKTATKE